MQFGRPIGSFQAIKHKCADMLLEVESAKSAAYYAAWAAAEDNDELPVVAALAKAYCSDAYFHAAAENIQIHGGIGFTWEHDAHLYFKRAKSTEQFLGQPGGAPRRAGRPAAGRSGVVVVAERFPIEEGHIASFARSIGDANSVFYGPGRALRRRRSCSRARSGTRTTSSGPKIGQPWFGSGKEPTGIKRDGGAGGGGGGGGGGLHAEQHYEYHRPLRVGDVLTATVKPGKTWEKEGRRAGKLVFSETVIEYRDQNGELVVTARGVGVRTEKRASEELTMGWNVGDTHETRRRRRPQAHADRAVRRRLRRLQPAAHRRDLRDEGRRLSDRCSRTAC